jgi:hypothetical protein
MFNDIETFKQNLKFQFTLKHLNKTLISNKGNNKIANKYLLKHLVEFRCFNSIEN